MEYGVTLAEESNEIHTRICLSSSHSELRSFLFLVASQSDWS